MALKFTKMNKRFLINIFLIGALSAIVVTSVTARPVLVDDLTETPTETLTPTETETPTASATPSQTETPSPEPTTTPTDTPTHTPTNTPTSTPTSAPVSPYPSAPLCLDSGELHDNSLFHTLWNSVDGCHYDHEHGTYPFTSQVASTFPGFDLQSLIGGVEVGHTNPSSPMENIHKHGGMKWDVTLTHTRGCQGGTGAPTGVNALVVHYHAFGDYSVEFEARVHSAVGLLRQCRTVNPTDYGYVFFNQFQDYGQRITPYQGLVLPYPDTPNPAYAPALPPYFSVDCVGSVPQCRPSLQYVLDRKLVASSTWASTFQGIGSSVFGLTDLRIRDNYQLFDWTDQTYPFTFKWLCSANGGVNYNAVGCRYNNSTTRVHGVRGEIPAAWDNLAGFDTNPTVGRITADGYVTAFGTRNPSCTVPGIDCHPIKLVNAFTGKYISQFSLVSGKGNFAPENLPKRDICFTSAGVIISCDLPGAIPSGWIGSEN